MATQQHGLEYMDCDESSMMVTQAQSGEKLCKEFTTWFYERLNTLTNFTSQHFWPDCDLRLEIFQLGSDKAIVDETLKNGEMCFTKIKDLVAVKQLCFDPDLSKIKGSLDLQSRVELTVGGTIFSTASKSQVGVFEQTFGLMRDPQLGNTYRVKFSILRLRERAKTASKIKPANRNK